MNWGHVRDCELSPRSHDHSYSAWCPSHAQALSFTHAHINPCVLLQREYRRQFNPLKEKHSSSLDVERLQELQKTLLWRWIRDFVFISMCRIRFICYIQVNVIFRRFWKVLRTGMMGGWGGWGWGWSQVILYWKYFWSVFIRHDKSCFT